MQYKMNAFQLYASPSAHTKHELRNASSRSVNQSHLPHNKSRKKLILVLLLFFLFLNLKSQYLEQSIVILIDSEIASRLDDEINLLKSDLEKENYQVVVKSSTYETPEDVRTYLQELYTSSTTPLIGAILMGEIPLAKQYFKMTYTNPDLSPTNHLGYSTQFYADLDGIFYKDNPEFPDAYATHQGDSLSEIWVSLLPYYQSTSNTIEKIRSYLNKNHAYRNGELFVQEGFLVIDEHKNAESQEQYDEMIQKLKSGTYSWDPFTEWGNVGLFINNTIGQPDAEYAYEHELHSDQYTFAALLAHGNPFSNGHLSIADVRESEIKPIFVWLGGCNTANFEYTENIASEITYSALSQTLITKGGSANVGGLGTSVTGFFGKNLANSMLGGKSLGQAVLEHNHSPLLYPWSNSFELYNAFNLYIGDLSLTLYHIPEQTNLINPENEENLVTLPLGLIWESSDHAVSYILELSNDLDFTNIIHRDSLISDTSVILEEMGFNTTYYWRVRGKNNSFVGPWSEPATFNLISAPSTPVLISPENNLPETDTSLTLSWDSIDFAKTYHLHLTNDDAFRTLLIDSNQIMQCHFSINGLQQNTQYFWRVKAKNDAGQSSWSEIWNFSTHLITGVQDLFTTDKKEYLSNFPNPFQQHTTINYEATKNQKVVFKIYNLRGMKIYENEIRLNKGNHKIKINTSDWKTGIYLLQLWDGSMLKKTLKLQKTDR